ncbi:MAG: EAL domain, c-di-GMP-specific phosphodiesterase class I (or its enzymatically inactive variant) [Candidatus Nitrotoga sp. MKT]|nr:MAG: EAL domain, c-di-GMP-specific phosphodiesterase class I (or its enzymatically inactive variant) [Candidatus Nitrotoga sp. MKT]
MSQLYRLNALQNELRDVLSLSLNDYRLEVQENDVRANFIGLQLRSVFQPIFNLATNALFGYEALLRAFDLKGNAIAPPIAFKQAEVAEKLVKFDRLCRTLHTLNYLNMGSSKELLFLNVHPELLVAVNSHGKIFERVLHNHSLPTDKVVIEINESAVSQDDLLNDAIANYRERGYKIAIDDFGKEHSNINRLCKFSPDYVKLDTSIIHLAEHNNRMQRILPKLVEIINELGAEVIIEGIETQSQLELAQHAGVQLVQGYFLGRPAPALSWEQADLTLRVAA